MDIRRALPLLLALALAAPACSSAESRSSVGTDPERAVVLPNFVRLSPDLAQGGEPEGDAAFERLAELGFRTVLSVDGAVPDVAGAEARGLRYVHVPIGYDGISDEAALAIAVAVTELDGPVYVHCHHGLHRGPAAAAVARLATGAATHEQALRDLAASGCSEEYQGLYRDVAAFELPGAAALAGLPAADLPNAVRPHGRLEAMVHLDEHFDLVRASRELGWRVPPRRPDVDPAHEVGMIENTLRDLLAFESDAGVDDAFLGALRESHAAAAELEGALRQGGDGGEADAAYGRLRQSCTACHAVYRN